MPDPDCPFVSRGGLKLDAALSSFNIDVTGMTCADLGANVGGFTDCLLQRGAKHVYAVDTAYGELAWTLRQDDRVTVLERTNALHHDPKQSLESFAGVDLVVVDLGWTRQERAIPAALRWLGPGQGADASLQESRTPHAASIISLIKPHYEVDKATLRKQGNKGVLPDDLAEQTKDAVLEAMPQLGVEVRACERSAIRGGKSRGRAGNTEYLAWLTPSA